MESQKGLSAGEGCKGKSLQREKRRRARYTERACTASPTATEEGGGQKGRKGSARYEKARCRGTSRGEKNDNARRPVWCERPEEEVLKAYKERGKDHKGSMFIARPLWGDNYLSVIAAARCIVKSPAGVSLGLSWEKGIPM